MFKTIKENTTAEIVEKKSKFIANIFYIETREEAEKVIKNLKKTYHDARHNCYAYRVHTKEGVIEKSSDDGEPSGTAGSPMLNILAKKGLENILVVVTRYFGGILLGTGGLVKAYSGACAMALEKALIIEKSIAYLYEMEIEYVDLNKVKHFANKNEILIVEEEYFENIKLLVAVKNEAVLKEFTKNGINVKNMKKSRETYI